MQKVFGIRSCAINARALLAHYKIQAHRDRIINVMHASNARVYPIEPLESISTASFLSSSHLYSSLISSYTHACACAHSPFSG